MTRQQDRTALDDMLEIVSTHGTTVIAEAFTTILNLAMSAERETALGAASYERSAERKGYANGFKPKTLATRVGELKLQVPKTRGISFYPSCLEKGVRSEKALTIALAEMYVQGVSTRRVRRILEEMCGLDVTSMQVSRAMAELDEQLEQWRNRDLATIRYLILDARYEKVRVDGSVRDCAVLVATGVREDGYRTILGTSVALSEAEVHWRSFLESLQRRGMKGVKLIVSDDHAGLKAARLATMPSIPWQRCQFHLQQNAQSYIPKVSMRAEVAQDIRSIFRAPGREKADERLAEMVTKYQEAAPKLAAWMESAIPEGLTVASMPEAQQRRLRTTNSVERLNRELLRRTRVVGLFPNEASLLRLVTAVLVEIDEDWTTSRIYLNPNPNPKP